MRITNVPSSQLRVDIANRTVGFKRRGLVFYPFSFHKAFVLCVGLLSLVEDVADRPMGFACGRHGIGCGRYGRGRYGLWPISS